MNPEELKNRILNSSKPIIIKNRLKWEILDWSLDKWKDTLKDEEMEFRVGKFESTKAPQWERNTKTIKGKFDKFLKEIEKETNTWLYFDYKYLNQVLLSATNLRNVHHFYHYFPFLLKTNSFRILLGMLWVFLKLQLMKIQFGLVLKVHIHLVILIHMAVIWFVRCMEGK